MKYANYIAPALVAVAAAISTVSCTSKQDAKTGNLSEGTAREILAAAQEDRANGNTAAADQKLKEAADHYARIGELLLMPEGISYADEMFGKALEIDPQNRKALFYKAGTELTLLLQGFVPRIERLATSEESNRELQRLRESVAKLKMPEVSKFTNSLPGGEVPFTTYYDVQRFLRTRYLPAVLASIDKLARIDVTTPLKLNFTPARALIDPVSHERTYSWSYSRCWNDPTRGWTCDNSNYDYHHKDPKLANEYFVDKHDLKIIRSSYAALADSIRLVTAFSIKDSEFAIRRLKGVDALRRESGLPGLTAQDVVTVLREFNDLFALEQDQQLPELAKSLAESLKAGLELEDMRSELCEKSTRTAENSVIRPICISADMVDLFRISLDALTGPKEIVLGKTSAGKEVRIIIDMSRVLHNPPKDLKALLPITFDAHGEPVNYPDPTMGGLFPRGDIISKIEELAGSPQGPGKSRVMKDIRRAIRDIKDHI